MKKITRLVIFLVLLFLYIIINAYSYSANISTSLSNNVLRLHIIANSNSYQDQNLKLLVRDSIVNYTNSICCNVSSKEDAIKAVSNHLNTFEQIANSVIQNNGFSYSATAKLGKFDFPTKKYSNIQFPSGSYDALEINLGDSCGQNWWCVLYPSLCFVNDPYGVIQDESINLLQKSLSPEECSIISINNSPCLKLKFKIVELFNQHKLSSSKIQKK